MPQKIKSFLRFLRDPAVSKWFLLRYAIGQTLAYSGIGKYVSFSTSHYRLYLTKSPIAMVMFGDPKYVRDEENILLDILQPGDTVLDVGANIGTFSLQAGKLVGESGKVFGFEAHPNTAEIFRKNVALNHLNNVSVQSVAIGNENGSILFSKSLNDDVNHVVDDSSGIAVESRRLDDLPFLKNLARIRCLNLDVEGYELFSLKGGEATIAKTDYVIFEAYEENCRRFGYSLEELFHWFTARGFALKDLITQEDIDYRTIGKEEVRNILATKL